MENGSNWLLLVSAFATHTIVFVFCVSSSLAQIAVLISAAEKNAVHFLFGCNEERMLRVENVLKQLLLSILCVSNGHILLSRRKAEIIRTLSLPLHKYFCRISQIYSPSPRDENPQAEVSFRHHYWGGRKPAEFFRSLRPAQTLGTFCMF